MLYWKENTDRPIEDIFDYLLFVSKTEWYKNFKSKYQRFYFSIPVKFLSEWDICLTKKEKNVIIN